MKILFDHQAFSHQRYGGVTRYFHELIRGLEALPGTDVELSLQYSDNEYIRSDPRFTIRAIPTWPWSTKRVRFLAAYLLDRRKSLARLHMGDYDIFHPTFYDRYFLSQVRAPFVLTIMDCIPERFPALFPNSSLYDRFVTRQWIANKRLLARSAARLIAISETTKADVVHFYGVHPEKVDVVHLATSVPTFRRESSSPPLTGSRYVLFVGSRWGYKNFPVFVHAMRPILERDSDLRVVCAGGGPFSEGEHALLFEAGTSGRYVQRDMSESCLAEAYQKATAFVFPSLWEGFGLPILEAFACGCPCVISNASCFPEVAGDAAEYFDPLDAESMTAAISRIIYDPSHREHIVDRGMARLSQFSWQGTALKTWQVYNRVLK